MNSSHKGQWRGALTFSLICTWINLSKQSWGWWSETPSRPLYRHCNVFFPCVTSPLVITMTSYERHVVLNHRSFDCLFDSVGGPTSKKHQSPRYWPFERGIHWWWVNSPHKGPVTQKKLPCDDVIMVILNSIISESTWQVQIEFRGKKWKVVVYYICGIKFCFYFA